MNPINYTIQTDEVRHGLLPNVVMQGITFRVLNNKLTFVCNSRTPDIVVSKSHNMKQKKGNK